MLICTIIAATVGTTHPRIVSYEGYRLHITGPAATVQLCQKVAEPEYVTAIDAHGNRYLVDRRDFVQHRYLQQGGLPIEGLK